MIAAVIGPVRSRLALLREQSVILGGLEEIVEADERRLASGEAGPDSVQDERRTQLLSRLDAITTELRTNAVRAGRPSLGKSGRPREVRAGADDPASLSSEGTGSEVEKTLSRSNGERARALEARTATILASLRGRQEEALRRLGEIRDVRRLLTAFGSGARRRADLDVRR